MITTKLDAVLRAVCPIDGVSIGSVDSKSTWRIDFTPGASPEQKLSAQQALNAFDVQAAKIADAQTDTRQTADGDELRASRMDAAIAMLLDATSAQRVAWAKANFPSLTAAEQNRLGLIMTMLALALRPQFRG